MKTLSCLCAAAVFALSSSAALAGGNDTCATAQPLTGLNGSLSGTFASANASNSVSCLPDVRPDFFFSFTAPCTGTLTVRTCGTNDLPGTDSGADTVLSLHPNACPLQAALNCNDDWNDPGTGGNCTGTDIGAARDSVVSRNMLAGQSVIIRLGSFDAAPVNPEWRMSYSFAGTGIANDTCATAAPISIGDSITLDVTCANTEINDSEACEVRRDAWYVVTVGAQSGFLRADTCGSADSYGVDTTVAMYLLGCDSLDQDYETVCDDDAHGICGASSTLDAAAVISSGPFQTWYIRVGKLTDQVNADNRINLNISFIPASGCNLPGDENSDGVVNFNDLNRVLGNFGNACP